MSDQFKLYGNCAEVVRPSYIGLTLVLRIFTDTFGGAVFHLVAPFCALNNVVFGPVGYVSIGHWMMDIAGVDRVRREDHSRSIAAGMGISRV